VAAWESIAALVRDVEDRAALAEREAWERLLRLEAKSTTTPVEDFAQRIDLLEGELAKAHQAQDVAEENSRGLSNAVADTERWQEESNRKCQEWVEELTLLQARGSELCQAIVGPPRVRSHLSEGM
jgi:chromosome segregation ATPase